jgi:hypothetical protein
MYNKVFRQGITHVPALEKKVCAGCPSKKTITGGGGEQTVGNFIKQIWGGVRWIIKYIK